MIKKIIKKKKKGEEEDKENISCPSKKFLALTNNQWKVLYAYNYYMYIESRVKKTSCW